jgi:secondary thiamine-phosphate synthase enzyme
MAGDENMTVENKELSLQTEGSCDMTDITPLVKKNVETSGINNGTITLCVPGSTAGLTTIEYESGLISDFQDMWNRIIPQNIPYEHNKAWGDGNGYSHMRASLLGPSLTIPFINKKLSLGTWQQIVFVDFDNRPRARRIILQIMGE